MVSGRRVACGRHPPADAMHRSRLYSQFDLKIIYLVAVFIFEVGSALCGAAPSMTVLVVGRAIAGFGGSGIYVGCINILSTMTAVKERAQYLAYLGMAWAVGTM
jgi:MFS family permease